MKRIASLGFRAKTGRAIAVALAEPRSAPVLLWRREISLVDPKLPTTAEPYHQVMELPWIEWQAVVQPLASAIERVAGNVLAMLIEELRSERIEVRAAGIVGAPDRKLEKIGNQHIRAHAAEGVLFRRVLEASAIRNDLRHRTFTERDLSGAAASELGAMVDQQLKALGRDAGPPWRADERMAATAAWLALQGERRAAKP